MRKIVLATIIGVFSASAALAQAPPAPPATTPPAAKAKPKAKAAPKERTPESIECSKQADAKGLHGQERIRFRANCKNKLLKQKKS